ncbi:carboxylesterase family protein [bacterium]|nr:carboxylesterase family protein [bacterium]RQV95507.1 MAG: carboxylesterase family protein [bacterium]
MKNSKLLFLIVSMLILSVWTGCSRFRLPEHIGLDSGLITGVPGRDPSVMVFKGIPYAAPPVGDLRWKPPQPVTPWTDVKVCDTFGPSAIQQAQAPFRCWSTEFIIDTSYGYSEDCLTLNVWTDKESTDGKRPVLMFIHGGGYTSGGSSCEIYDGEGLAKKGVVVVTINYRVGILGFFAHPDLSAESEYNVSGNYAILDMIAALKWIKNNIAAFGGDPNNVTIQGQSAGSSAVHVLTLSPLTRGLIHRAIAQSFNLVNSNMLTLAEAEEAGKASAISDNNNTPRDPSDDRIVEAVGMMTLEEMRAMSVEKLLTVSYRSSPIIDGYVLTGNMLDILKACEQNDIPLISGMTAGDGGLFGGSQGTLAQYRQNAERRYGDMADAFLVAYPAENDEEAAIQSGAAAIDNNNVLGHFLGKLRSLHGKSDTYIYFFTRVMPGPESDQWGAFHTADVPYGFNILSPLRADYWTQTDYDLANAMSSYFATFTRTGNPNGSRLPEWPAYQDGKLEFMELGDTIAPLSLSQEKADFWEAYYEKVLDLNQ